MKKSASAILNIMCFVLWQMQSHVDVTKLVPPSFHGLSVMTEALPSLNKESTVCPRPG